MGINELILVGTGFVLARVVYLFYFAPKKGAEADRRLTPRGRQASRSISTVTCTSSSCTLQRLPHRIRLQARRSAPRLTMHAYLPLADPPDVQVAQPRRTRQSRDHVAHFGHDRRVHLGIEQHAARVAQQAERPAPDQHHAGETHHRVEPRGAEVLATGERDDREHRGRRVGHDVQVSRAQVQVVVMVVIVAVVAAVPVIVTRAGPCPVDSSHAETTLTREADHRDRDGFVEPDRRAARSVARPTRSPCRPRRRP